MPKQGTDLEIDFDELGEQQRAFEALHPGATDSFNGPLWREVALRIWLPELEKKYNLEKQSFFLFRAIDLCAKHSLTMPDWVASAFSLGFNTVHQFEYGSWDEAFGRPYPGKQLTRLRERRKFRDPVWKRVNELVNLDPTRPFDNNRKNGGNGIFEQVGKELGLGRTRVSELYYETLNELQPFVDNGLGRTFPVFRHKTKT
jgi:hypothetical protein